MSYADSYGKIFRITFTGSMAGAGPDVFAVWAYVIANTTNGRVFMSAAGVAALIGMPTARVKAVFAYLCKPDSESKNQERGGRRLVHVAADEYEVVSHHIYRKLNNTDAVRDYNREAQRRSRANKKAKKAVAEKVAPHLRVVDDGEIPY